MAYTRYSIYAVARKNGWMLVTTVMHDNIPYVDIVCFDLVNRSPVICSTSTSWLCDITVNQPKCC